MRLLNPPPPANPPPPPANPLLLSRYSPVGIMFIVMAEYSVSDIQEYASQIGMYIVTVLVGLAIHLFIVLPSILFSFTRRNPFSYYKALLPAMATAFGKPLFNLITRVLLSYCRCKSYNARRNKTHVLVKAM